MAKRKTGLPAGFDLGITKPSDKPIRVGDYLDEIDSKPAGTGLRPPPQTGGAEKGAAQAEPKPILEPTAEPAPRPTRSTTTRPSSSGGGHPSRTRLNVSQDGQRRLDAIWERMREFGPEKTLRKSEIIEAMILATYEARDQLDLSNVRKRGKYGSATHKNFPIALSESVRRAIATTENDI